MILIEHDERLIAMNDTALTALAWAPGKKEWLATANDFPRKAFALGRELTPAQASKRFRGADLAAAEARLG